MKLKLTNSFFFIFLALNCFSQEKQITIQGKIYSTNNIVKNVHVFNLTKKAGTISNDLGLFELKVSINDTLLISSIQYEKKYILITKKNVEAKQIEIELISLVNVLDEVFLKHLSGDLNLDIANKPEDTIPKHNYKPLRTYNKTRFDGNENDGYINPMRKDFTNPIGGSGAGAPLPDKRYKKLLKLKRELKQKKEFPEIIKRELGIDYFTVTLKIPREKINHFLSYCEYRNIVEKYNNNKQLEVITILNEESKKYNAIKN